MLWLKLIHVSKRGHMKKIFKNPDFPVISNAMILTRRYKDKTANTTKGGGVLIRHASSDKIPLTWSSGI